MPRHVIARCSLLAFTLLELAIVMVVIALIIGGITLGMSSLRQSELQSVIAEYNQFAYASSQFMQQYGGPPGDIIDAVSYWGDNTTYCSDGDGTNNGSPGTCNGDGDGKIYTSNTLATLDATHPSEPFRAWQQLSLAKFYQNNLTGLPGSGAALQSTPDTNVPKSKFKNAGWSFYNNTALVGNANWYNQDLGNLLMFGDPATNTMTQSAALTPAEAAQIDRKIDDALPATGRVVAMKPAPSTITPNCTTSAVDASALYNLTYNDVACNLSIGLLKQ